MQSGNTDLRVRVGVP